MNPHFPDRCPELLMTSGSFLSNEVAEPCEDTHDLIGVAKKQITPALRLDKIRLTWNQDGLFLPVRSRVGRMRLLSVYVSRNE